ncbi:MAG: DsrE family protein [Leptospirillia bacterium]
MTEAPPRRVLILLLRSPEWTPYTTVLRLADALVAEGSHVTLFLMDDAVLGLVAPHGKPRELSPVAPLLSRGIEVAICQSTAEIRGIGPEDLPTGARFETQVQLGHLAGTVDLFLPFVN